GSAQEHLERAQLVRDLARREQRFVAILADLQGPKLRIARFTEGKIELQVGQPFTLDAGMDKNAGTQDSVGIDYEQLIQDVAPGDCLLLDDRRIELAAEDIRGHQIQCRVLVGGPLSNNKGLNKNGGGPSSPAPTEKDLVDIQTAAQLGADYVAVSFVRTAE